MKPLGFPEWTDLEVHQNKGRSHKVKHEKKKLSNVWATRRKRAAKSSTGPFFSCKTFTEGEESRIKLVYAPQDIYNQIGKTDQHIINVKKVNLE